MSFQGSHILITGGSRGLGRALAETLGAHGARLTLVARGEAELVAAADAVRAAGGEALAVASDIAEPESTPLILGRAAARFGPIDVVVHAASTLGPTPLRLLVDTEPADFGRAFQTNVGAAWRLTRAVAGAMLVRGQGTVVFISSDAAVEAYPRWGAYGASKAAADHVARTFAAELEGTGIRVLAIDPGEMATKMHADAVPDADPATLADPRDVARVVAAILADSIGAPSGARVVAAAYQAAR